MKIVCDCGNERDFNWAGEETAFDMKVIDGKCSNPNTEIHFFTVRCKKCGKQKGFTIYKTDDKGST